LIIAVHVRNATKCISSRIQRGKSLGPKIRSSMLSVVRGYCQSRSWRCSSTCRRKCSFRHAGFRLVQVSM